MIGLGTGGIKPCVSAFGGEQFKDSQVRQIVVVCMQSACIMLHITMVISPLPNDLFH